ncbi:hypothetical protein MIR68_003793 [Amoeboaphelidium protococcarum]|nr:hypothetical protein MIR68_003793 [Amoeboaphelidium protococcarum]
MPSSNNLPYAAEVNAELSPQEIEVLEDAYKRAAVTTRGQIPSQIKFNYAWGLVRSRFRDDQLKGVSILQELYDEDVERRRECTYYLALGYFKLGKYAESRRFNAMLLRDEPNNAQAQSLQKVIDDKVASESFIGMAVVGGVVALSGLVLGAILKRK